MADYKKIDLQIGTEEQFEEKKLSLPVGTLVGITDPIHESELDTDLQTKINEVSNKLTAPATPTADSAVTMLADGTVGTKPLTSITGKTEVYVGSTTPTNPDEILWIDPNGTSGGGGSSVGKLYRHNMNFTIKTTSPPHKYDFYFESSKNTELTKTNVFEKLNEISGASSQYTSITAPGFTYPVNSGPCTIEFRTTESNSLTFYATKYDGTVIDDLHFSASNGIPETISITDIVIEH